MTSDRMIDSNISCRIPHGIARELLQWWQEWQTILAVTLSMALQLLLLICGSLRKCSSSRVLQLAAWLAYMSADSVAVYALGLMLSSTSCHSVYSIWAPLLLFHLGGPDNFTAYSDTDNELWSRHMIVMGFQVCAACTVIFTSARGQHVTPAILLVVAGSGKYAEKTLALRSGSHSEIVGSVKPICLFMSYEPSMGMEGYNYLVSGERYWQNKVDSIKPDAPEDPLRAISIRDVLECEQLQRIDEGRRWYSVCLAHALFKLTKRRLADAHFEEARQRKTRDFLFNEEYVPAGQVFPIIEMELGFLFDLVFTKSSGTAYTVKGIMLRLLNAAMLCAAEYLLFKEGVRDFAHGARRKLTYVLITSAGAVEIIQLLRVIFSDWTKVWVACTYIKLINARRKNCRSYIGPGLHRAIICCTLYLMKAMDKLPTWKYWKNCIEQHSIIETCLKTRKGPWKYVTRFLPRGMVVGLIGTVCDEIPQEFKASVMERLHGLCTCEEDTFTLSEIMGSVLGLTLLGVECINLRWASSKDMVHAILHWHIATSLCEMYSRRSSPSSEWSPEDLTGRNYRMAKKISMYCAYVLVACPRLLPIHPDVARMKYKEVYAETRELLHGVVDLHGDPYYTLIEYDKQTTLGDGVALARQMLQMEDGQRWRILADVWFDLLLCMAVTNNAAAHVKRLAMGGEFLTIIWTLLGHVGLGYHKGDQRWDRSLQIFKTALPFASMV